MSQMTTEEKKRRILRRLSKMTDFSVKSLGLTSKKDREIVSKIKEKV